MRRGFTLIEVLTVIAIIGILTSITAYLYASALTRSRDSQRVTDLASIQNSLEQFYLDNRHYPVYQTNIPTVFQAKYQLEEGFDCHLPTKEYLAPHYMTSIPQDPSSTVSGNACGGSMFGHYLYFGTPTDSSRSGFVLLARMERANRINWLPTVGQALEQLPNTYRFFDNVSPCNQTGFAASPTTCSHNYYLKSSRNN